MASLVWNVIYHSVNEDKIKTFNVFNHGGFREDLKKLYKKYPEKEEFAEELRRSLMYYFWCKCEWEIIIGPWCGGRDTKEIKVDVYWQECLGLWRAMAFYGEPPVDVPTMKPID